MTITTSLAGATRTLHAAGIPDAAHDAALLLEHALGRDRAWLRAHGDEPVPDGAEHAFASLVEGRAAREPLAYLVGWTAFLGMRLDVTPDVLIPRPETETFVEEILRRAADAPPRSVLDVGTGSGAIACALARGLQGARVVASDVSPAALTLARRNAAALGAEIAFHEADLLDGVDGPFDLLVANLPYLTADEMKLLPPEVAREPALALAGGEDGNALVAKMLRQSPRVMASGGSIALELHPGNIASTTALAHTVFPHAEAVPFADLAGVERFLWISTGVSELANS